MLSMELGVVADYPLEDLLSLQRRGVEGVHESVLSIVDLDERLDVLVIERPLDPETLVVEFNGGSNAPEKVLVRQPEWG